MSDDTSAVDEQKAIKAQVAPQTKTDKEKNKALSEFSQTEDNGQLSMRIKVHSPFREYFVGQAFSISAENTTGPFDILPKHHNFISLLSPCDLAIRSVKAGDQKISISGGIMHVKADSVTVFLDV